MHIKCILFGGTFDPVHCGHIGMLEQLNKEVVTEQIIIIPNKRPPHKAMPIATDQQRLALLNIARPQFPSQCVSSGYVQYKISSLEINRSGPSYMIDTVNYYLAKQKVKMIGLLMGGDSFLSFHRWVQYELLLKKVIPIVVPRYSVSRTVYLNYQKEKLINKAIILSSGTVDISSSQIRKKNNRGCLDTGISAVNAYIKKEGLY